MNNLPDISIIILNYNTFSITCKCIESVIKYTLSVSYEIILVDNASSERDADEFKIKFPRIYLIKNSINSGFSKGNNLGINKATGKYFLLLNSDVELLEDSISKCYNFLEENKNVGVVSPKLVYPDGTIQYVAERFPSIKLELLRLIRWNWFISKERCGKLFLSYFFNHQQNIKADYLWGAFFVIRKEVIDILPGKKLDESFFMYAEDMVWCYDITKKGYETWYFADTTAQHIHSYSLRKGYDNSGKRKLVMMMKNKYIFLRREKGQVYSFIYMIVELLNAVASLNFLKVGVILKGV